MKTTLMTAMMTSISEVMETMFFLPVEPGRPLPFGQWDPHGDPLVCRLAFHGDVSGTLLLAAPVSLAQEMAENFMGELREDLTPEHLSGTMTEMLNMVCGNALSRVKSDTPYGLEIPEMVQASQIPREAEFSIVETPESAMGVCLVLA